MNADEQIKRLLRVRDQIDDAIDTLNAKGVANHMEGDKYSGILLPSPRNDDDYALIVFGRQHFQVCQKALALYRKESN